MRANQIKQAGWTVVCMVIAAGVAQANPQTFTGMSAHFFKASRAATVGASKEDTSFDNVDIIDTGLNGKVAVLRVGSDIGVNKLLAVFAGFRNKSERRLDLEIQTIYKDTYGNALNSGSWIPFTLKAHEEKEYHSSSISEQATDFLVRVRRAQASSKHD